MGIKKRSFITLKKGEQIHIRDENGRVIFSITRRPEALDHDFLITPEETKKVSSHGILYDDQGYEALSIVVIPARKLFFNIVGEN